MLLRYTLISSFLFCYCLSNAQVTDTTTASERKVIISTTARSKDSIANTYAVIVGISAYTHIPSLQYADKDAVLFREFLQSRSGGSVKDSNIFMILNAEAKESLEGQIMDWIDKVNPKQGDRVYFYFAGHGDAINGDNIFFLLPECNPNGSRNAYLYGNVLRMADLKSLLFKNNLLSKNVQVILIWDACRTGELQLKTDGSAVQQSLAERSDGEIVMISASAGENAIEDKSYADGHGLFTYYLIDGLNGAADKSPTGNDDGNVSIKELQLFVTMNVSHDAETKFKGKEQNPKFTFTSNPGPLSKPDVQFNKFWVTQKSSNTTIAFADPKSVGRSAGVIKDTAVNNLYNLCMQAINSGNMEGENGAQGLLAKLESNYPANELTKNANFNIAMEYINLAQEKINLYFNGLDDIKEFDITIQGDLADRVRKSTLSSNAANAGYLDKAITILKRSNFRDTSYLRQLESKEYFLLARSYHMKENRINNSADAFDYIRKAINIDPNAAYNYHMLGLLFYDEKNYQEAVNAESKAVELAPNWSYVLNGLGNYMEKQGFHQSAIRYYKMAFQNNPTYINSYGAYITYYDLGNIYYNLKTKEGYDSALVYYKASISTEPKNVYLRYYNIGNIYNLKNQPDSALPYFKKAIEINPSYIEAYNNAGNSYIYLGTDFYDSAIVMYRHTVQIDPNYVKGYNNLAFVFTKAGQYQLAIDNYRKAIDLLPTDAVNYFRLALVYIMNKDIPNGLINLETAFQKGYNNIGAIKADHNLDPARENEKYKELIKKYFPNN